MSYCSANPRRKFPEEEGTECRGENRAFSLRTQKAATHMSITNEHDWVILEHHEIYPRLASR